MSLPFPDSRLLNAAEGWLELGDWQSANDELEDIKPTLRAHPDVLKMRVAVYLAAKHWELALAVAETVVELLPGDLYGWIHRSFALHELKRTAEAQEKLKPAAKKFPKQHLVFYNLACYACQLGELKEALRLLGNAIRLAGQRDIRLMALADRDLEPLWQEIGEI